MNTIDDLYLRLATLETGSARRLFAQIEALHDGRLDEAREWLEGQGWTVIDAVPADAISTPDGKIFLQDGREVRYAQGKWWVLAADEQQRRVAAAIAARKAETLSGPAPVLTAEALASTTCPQITDGHICGGGLQKSGICPSCALGRAGYIYRYTCESCGYDIAVQKEMA